jgi:hypothetical protein
MLPYALRTPLCARSASVDAKIDGRLFHEEVQTIDERTRRNFVEEELDPAAVAWNSRTTAADSKPGTRISAASKP